MRLIPETPARQSLNEALKTREEETWQTSNYMDYNNSKIPEQERNLYKPARHKCNQRTRADMPWSCGMESKMQHAGNPRDVATEPVNDV